MKKKLLLLATAVVFFSPVAAKANQKSSIYVGITGALERLASQGGDTAQTRFLKDENIFALGLEAGFGYKVWNNLQLAGWVRGLYGPEHKFDAKKAQEALPYSIVVEPRVTLGWEFPVSANISITPFVGAGWEMSWAKTDGKEFKMKWKVPAVLGVRANFGFVYASVNGRFDLTASEINAKTDVREADTFRNWGMEASVGAEF